MYILRYQSARCLLIPRDIWWDETFTVSIATRDTLVSNESVSNQPEGSYCAHSDTCTAFPSTLGGNFAERLLVHLIDAFHATPVLACTPDGVILFANKVASSGFKRFTAQTVIGQNLLDFSPKAWALERIEFMKHTAERGRPLVVVEIIMGTRLCTTITPIEHTDKELFDRILLITVEKVTPTKLKQLRNRLAPGDIIDAKVVDLGPLSILSRRELEILALMGQGLRQKQIAERLHRSVSTIDRHRERIGEKLGMTDRIDLVTLAREAALEFSDATRTVSSVGPKPSSGKPEEPEST